MEKSLSLYPNPIKKGDLIKGNNFSTLFIEAETTKAVLVSIVIDTDARSTETKWLPKSQILISKLEQTIQRTTFFGTLPDWMIKQNNF